jgi:hypothetical protein
MINLNDYMLQGNDPVGKCLFSIDDNGYMGRILGVVVEPSESLFFDDGESVFL